MSDLYDEETEDETPDKPLPRKTAAAQEQADDADALGRSARIATPKTNEVFRVPGVLLLDDDQLAAYEKLHFELNQCDRHPDVETPAQRFVHKNPDGNDVETEIGAHTVRGDFIQPYQKDGALIEPPYSIQLAQIFWGKDGYERFKAGGGRSAEIPDKLGQLNREMRKRVDEDSKSASGGGDLAASADGDRS